MCFLWGLGLSVEIDSNPARIYCVRVCFGFGRGTLLACALELLDWEVVCGGLHLSKWMEDILIFDTKSTFTKEWCEG